MLAKVPRLVTGGATIATMKLHPRAAEIAQRKLAGETYISIAKDLGLSPTVVRNQGHRAMWQAEIERLAEEHGISLGLADRMAAFQMQSQPLVAFVKEFLEWLEDYPRPERFAAEAAEARRIQKHLTPCPHCNGTGIKPRPETPPGNADTAP